MITLSSILNFTWKYTLISNIQTLPHHTSHNLKKNECYMYNLDLIEQSEKSFNSAPFERVKPPQDKTPAAELTFYTISTQPQLRTRTQRAILFSRRAHRTHTQSLKSRQSRSIKRRQCFYFTADLFFLSRNHPEVLWSAQVTRWSQSVHTPAWRANP